VASAIRIGDPASYERAVRAIRETDGMVLAVSDEEIMEAKAVVDASGVGCEPASAASVAGARALRRAGEIRAGDDVVAVLTGHMLKDPEAITDYHRSAARPGEGHPLANPPVEMDATLAALARALEGGARSARPRAAGR
jgi:threonine synthase